MSIPPLLRGHSHQRSGEHHVRRTGWYKAVARFVWVVMLGLKVYVLFYTFESGHLRLFRNSPVLESSYGNEKHAHSPGASIHLDHSAFKSGLSHQISNMRTLLRVAYNRGWRIVEPRFHLHPKHNDGRASLLSAYIDYDRITVNGAPINFLPLSAVAEPGIINVTSATSLLRMDPRFNISGLPTVQAYVPFKREIVARGEEVARRLGRDGFACVHVRRGDRLTTPQIEKDTSPESVADTIVRLGLVAQKVYVCTNEKDQGYYDLLREVCSRRNISLSMYLDHPDLKAVREEDNYLLFSIENVMCDRAKARVSTFRVLGSSSYLGSLSELPGAS